MADALNRRIHQDTIGPTAPTIGVARGHRVAVGDIIISRRNDPTIPVLDATDDRPAADPVRNGNRWRAYAIDPEHNRIAARRLDDDARAAFTGDYLSEHITYGNAITVHAAQGVTADSTHAVLGERTTRAMLYVAMTRGRESNAAYVYQRAAGEGDHQHQDREDLHVARRGSGHDAARLIRDVVARDERMRSAHEASAGTERRHLTEPTGSFVDRRAKAAQRRGQNYLNRQEPTYTATSRNERGRDYHVTRTRNPDFSIQR